MRQLPAYSALALLAVIAIALFVGDEQASAESATSLSYRPPPIVLTSVAGRQRAVQSSYCISVPTDGGGTTLCADYVDVEPRLLSVVRPKEHVTIRLRGAETARGAVYVHPRGCERRYVQRFNITRPLKRWVVHLDSGAYELSVFALFTTADGRSGDTSGELGVLISKTRAQGLIPVGDRLDCGR
jgi:hypothetical protein